MKKATFIFLSIVLMTMSVFAQTSDNNTLKFLGIPVDGTKENMIAKLKEKGFTYDATSDVLRGKFNGNEAEVLISTNHEIVDRVIVIDENLVNESNIRINYNNLIGQMNKNVKYKPFDDNKLLDEREDISYEMTVHNKRYEASYILATDNERNPNGMVWFMIVERYGKYYIAMYYDNLKNRPDGEDL